jgi:hypothetical protein
VREILLELNRESGILGSMIVTPDGIMVAAALGPEHDEDVMAAVASSVLLGLRRTLARFSRGEEFCSCTLQGSRAKIAFVDMKNAYLVLVAEPSLKLGSKVGVIENAIYRIQHRSAA